ncbi:AAA family ATPase [Chloroflexota bacterium]
MSEWLVKGFIESEQTLLLLGQPGNGKSWWINELAIDVASGTPHLGWDVVPHSVILIDEDSTKRVVNERLHRLAKAVRVPLDQLPIACRSLSGFLLWNDSQRQQLIHDIDQMEKKYGRPVLVIIDSLSKVMLGFDLDKATKATKATAYWDELKATGATVLIVHHMSLKKPVSWQQWDITALSMGSTMLVAGSDSALGIFRIPPREPTRFVMKPTERRFKIALAGSVGIELIEDQDLNWARLRLLDEIPTLPSEAAKRIFPLFRDDGEELWVKTGIERVGKDLTEAEVREALHELEREGCLERAVEKGKAHRFKYRLHPDFKHPMSLTTEYKDELRQ